MAGYFLSPYAVLLSLKRSVDKKNVDKINSFIDFPEVRKGLSEQINEILVQKSYNKIGAKYNIPIGRQILSPLINRSVNLVLNKIISPGSLDWILNNNNFIESNFIELIKVENDYKQNSYNESKNKFKYISINKFVVINSTNNNYEPFKIYLYRSNLLNWKIRNIIIPKSILNNIMK